MFDSQLKLEPLSFVTMMLIVPSPKTLLPGSLLILNDAVPGGHIGGVWVGAGVVGEAVGEFVGVAVGFAVGY